MSGKKLVAASLLLVLAGAAVVAWMERTPLRSWYYLRGLSQATEADRADWIDRLTNLGEPAVDGLLEQLDGDEQACRNAAAALDHLAHTWGGADPRAIDLVSREAQRFSRLPPSGQALLLHGVAGWLAETGSEPPAGLLSACTRLLSDAGPSTDAGTQLAALELAAELVRQPRLGEWLKPARDLARAALQSPAPANRLLAVRLSLHQGMDLLENVVALLNDPAVEVRRAALVAVGSADQVVRDEGLLPCLHDPDPEVRKVAEEALRGRGLRPEHIELGRLLTDPDHKKRVQVLDHLREAPDLDPGLWLRRLSHDPARSVRVAAARVMSELTFIDLSDRLDQMARSDPEPSVAWLAQYYLEHRRSKAVPAPPPPSVER
jgi:hypothetical protein